MTNQPGSARIAYDKEKLEYQKTVAPAYAIIKEQQKIIAAAQAKLDIAIDAALDAAQRKFDFYN